MLRKACEAALGYIEIKERGLQVLGKYPEGHPVANTLREALTADERMGRAFGLVTYLKERGITVTMTNDRPDGMWGVCFLRDTSVAGSWAAADSDLATAILRAGAQALEHMEART